MPKLLIKSLGLLIISALLITLCYFFVDRQLVWFLVSHHSRQSSIFQILANYPVLIISALVFIFYLYFFIKLSLSKTAHTDKIFLTACNAIVISLFLKNICKIIFARYWAATFVCHNPSLISNHVYGFNWLQAGSTYSSFPSGHTAFISAFAVSLWFLLPKLRYLWALIAACVAVGQVGAYYHFLSDVIAGATLGGLVGLYSAQYYAKN